MRASMRKPQMRYFPSPAGPTRRPALRISLCEDGRIYKSGKAAGPSGGERFDRREPDHGRPITLIGYGAAPTV